MPRKITVDGKKYGAYVKDEKAFYKRANGDEVEISFSEQNKNKAFRWLEQIDL